MLNRHRWSSAWLILALIAFATLPNLGANGEIVRIGIITDVHANNADSPAEGKVMTNYVERLDAFVAGMAAWEADAILELGDLVNGTFVMGPIGDEAAIPGILEEAVLHLHAFDGPVHHVAGNHDFYSLSLEEYLALIDRETATYSFDVGGFHFAVLDAQFNEDGTHYDHVFWRSRGEILTDQLDWLRADLAETTLPTIVLIHQPLDSDFDTLVGGPPVANHLEVQGTLVAAGNVIAVFQGHDHDNRHNVIDGIHYITFAAMVDHTVSSPPTWAQVTLDATERTMQIEGFGLQESYSLTYGQ